MVQIVIIPFYYEQYLGHIPVIPETIWVISGRDFCLVMNVHEFGSV